MRRKKSQQSEATNVPHFTQSTEMYVHLHSSKVGEQHSYKIVSHECRAPHYFFTESRIGIFEAKITLFGWPSSGICNKNATANVICMSLFYAMAPKRILSKQDDGIQMVCARGCKQNAFFHTNNKNRSPNTTNVYYASVCPSHGYLANKHLNVPHIHIHSSRILPILSARLFKCVCECVSFLFALYSFISCLPWMSWLCSIARAHTHTHAKQPLIVNRFSDERAIFSFRRVRFASFLMFDRSLSTLTCTNAHTPSHQTVALTLGRWQCFVCLLEQSGRQRHLKLDQFTLGNVRFAWRPPSKWLVCPRIFEIMPITRI